MSISTLPRPTQKRLPDIMEVKPRTEEDKPLMDDLVAVLRKHNALDRFGLTLLHQHFDIGDDEILLETTDIKTREQFIRPVKLATLEGSKYAETSWRLDSGAPMMGCVCPVHDNGNGGTEHEGHQSRG